MSTAALEDVDWSEHLILSFHEAGHETSSKIMQGKQMEHDYLRSQSHAISGHSLCGRKKRMASKLWVGEVNSATCVCLCVNNETDNVAQELLLIAIAVCDQSILQRKKKN